MKKIITAITQIQRGNFKTHIEVSTKDEIGLIADNLNTMSLKIDDFIEKEYVTELKIKNSELKQSEAKLRQKSAELYALQSQIDPHFLYNTLEVIRMKALSTNESEVAKMIQCLATMFRNSIKDEIVVSLKDELEFCKSYVELYNIRFVGNLSFIYDVEPELFHYGIIKHLLQPIIENCIIHGLDLSTEENVIQIIGYLDQNKIKILISDNGIGMKEEQLKYLQESLSRDSLHTKDSIGIVNVNQRIQLVYGEDYGISITSKDQIGTEVMITLAAKSKEELNTSLSSLETKGATHIV